MTFFVSLWQEVKSRIHHMLTTGANYINQLYDEKLAFPFLYPTSAHTYIRNPELQLKVPHSLRNSAMLK